jgi:hypothetical protein
MNIRVAIVGHDALQQPQHKGNVQQQATCTSISVAAYFKLRGFVSPTNDPLVHRQMRNRQIQRGGRNNENLEAKQMFT